MNILFISKVTSNLSAGPNYSVPAQVLAQAKIDNVMWVNLNHVCRPEWRRKEYQFINFDDIHNCSLKDLPEPFNKPDYIIFEGIYCFTPFDKLVRTILKTGISYAIVPRSSLTFKAQKGHSLKKKICNLLFYNKFINKSNAIQYLTQREKMESEKIFHHRCFVIPNGTYLPHNNLKNFSKDGVRVIYVGRLEIQQKGLDNLVQAVALIKDKLINANVTIELYGPDKFGRGDKLNKLISKFHVEDIVKINSPVYDIEKSKVLSNADVFIMTSRFEGMPMGLIEALGHGLPCIATEGTFFMEEIVSHNAGWGAGSSIHTVKDALLRMISESWQLEEKSINARKLATRYSWDSLAKTLHNQIKETI